MASSPMDADEAVPSLLQLDSFCLVHVSQFLTNPRDLASLQLTCKTLFTLLQANGVWARVLKLNYGGIQLQVTAPSSAAPAAEPLLPIKELSRLLSESGHDLHPVRFVAVYTNGGVDTGTLHYWADHAFVPNSWAPFCAKLSDNVNLLSILKTGPDTIAELTHRRMMIGCLKWVLPLLQQNPMPRNPDTYPVEPERLQEAAELLSAWKTQRLESFFCQMAMRAAGRDPLGMSMLRGLPAAMATRRAAAERRAVDPVEAMAERREAARVLGQGIQMRTWYDRAYRLIFTQPQPQRGPQQAVPQGGPGQAQRGGPGILPSVQATAATKYDSPYVLDEMAVQSELMTPRVASSVAILHGFAVSREGRLSCPVRSGALLAGLLPPDWPHSALAAVMPGATPSEQPGVLAYEAMMRAVVEQPGVRALNDKLDAESVFSACANGQLPPWVRHVVMEHVEYIELLPPHLAEELPAEGGKCNREESGAARGSAPGPSQATSFAGVPKLYPVLWFRFTEHTEYSRRRLSSRGRTLLRQLMELLNDAADLLEAVADELLDTLRAEVTAWAGDPSGHTSDLRAGKTRLMDGLSAAAESDGVGASHESAVAPAEEGAAEDPCGSAATATLASEAAAGSALGRRSGTASEPAVLCRLPRPESLSSALHRAIRLADRLTSLGTVATVLAPELCESAAFQLPDSHVHGLLEQGTIMKAALSHVARQLASLEELRRPAQARTLADGTAAPGTTGQRTDRATGEDDDMDEDDHMGSDGVERVETGSGSSSRGGGRRRMPEAGAASSLDRGVAPPAGPEMGRRGVHGLEATLRMEVQRALCGKELMGARNARLALAASLRTLQAAAAAAAMKQTVSPEVVEHRNEELLRRLPIIPPPPGPAPIVVAPAAAAAPLSPLLGVGRAHEGAAQTGAAASAADANSASGGARGSSSGGGTSIGAGGSVATPPPATAPGPQFEPPPPAEWAAERLFDPMLQHDVDSGRVILPEADEDGHRVVHMAAQLMFPVAANAVVFKAIRPENLMAMVGWDENERPNVDVQYVALQGRVVRLPPGVQVVPGP